MLLYHEREYIYRYCPVFVAKGPLQPGPFAPHHFIHSRPSCNPYEDEDATLAQAARVCRTFADVALAALWSSLPTLLPLWPILEALSMMQNPADPPQVEFIYVRTYACCRCARILQN